MKVLHFSPMFLVVTLSASIVSAQGGFFWSSSELNSGAIQESDHVVNNTAVGDTGSLYLYYSTEASDLDTGAGLDLSWTNNDVIAFTSAETFDFNIVLTSNQDIVIGQRWGTDLFPDGVDFGNPASSVSGNAVTGLNAFEAISGQGILTSNNGSGTFFDQGYDTGADGFLFARVDWERIGIGETQLLTQAGSIGIVHDGATVDPKFGTATFSTVPEPAAGAGLLMLVLCGAGFRRR